MRRPGGPSCPEARRTARAGIPGRDFNILLHFAGKAARIKAMQTSVSLLPSAFFGLGTPAARDPAAADAGGLRNADPAICGICPPNSGFSAQNGL